MRDDKKLLKNAAAIALPMAAANLLDFGISLSDIYMLGLADSTGTLLSASAIAIIPHFILTLFIFGMAGGGTVLCSQYYGKRDFQTIRVIFSMLMKFALVIGVVFTLASVIFTEQIMMLLTSNVAAATEGAKYLRITGISFFFYALYVVVEMLFRSVEVTKISVCMSTSALIICVALNYLLIFGNCGFPKLGIVGAAVSTLIARAVNGVILFAFLFFEKKKLCFRPKHMLLFDKKLLPDLAKYGAPVMINESLWGIGTAISAVVMGHMGTEGGDPVAAKAIAQNAQQIAMLLCFGTSNASLVIVGKLIGGNSQGGIQPKIMAEIRHVTKIFMILAIIIGVMSFCIMHFGRGFIVGLYHLDATQTTLAENMISMLGVASFFSSVSAMQIIGILRGGGDTRYCLFLEVCTMYFIALPLGFVSGFVFNLNPVAVYGLMRIDELIKSILGMIRLLGTKWIHNVTRDMSAEHELHIVV
ncbi:MATE family efflux transporter [Clostridia bacterium]|nr:MATE family efflux transporter [Clostridia bacterium]